MVASAVGAVVAGDGAGGARDVMARRGLGVPGRTSTFRVGRSGLAPTDILVAGVPLLSTNPATPISHPIPHLASILHPQSGVFETPLGRSDRPIPPFMFPWSLSGDTEDGALSEQSVKLPLDDAIALARGRFEAWTVEYRHPPAGIADETGLAEPTGRRKSGLISSDLMTRLALSAFRHTPE